MNRTTTTYPPLSIDYIEVFFADEISLMKWSPAILVPNKAVQKRRNICRVKMFGQILLQEDQIRPTIQRTGQKERSNEVINEKDGANIDRETLLSCTRLRTVSVLLRPHMGIMLINVLPFLFFFSASSPHRLQQRHLRPCFPM
ncbi:hypothetical protein TNCV_1478531 [Trichonephila clavipes]|nr:hypothetical protein TNCV_1478531 [Trichonephila clavipes]